MKMTNKAFQLSKEERRELAAKLREIPQDIIAKQAMKVAKAAIKKFNKTRGNN